MIVPVHSTARLTPTSSRRVLLIEDERAIRTVVRRFLERCGCQVDEAGDGVEARARLFGGLGTYDLVICDLNLPDCSGLDLRRAFARSSPHLIDRFVIATGESVLGSGALPSADARELMSRGRLLSKPFSLDELSALVRELTPAVAA